MTDLSRDARFVQGLEEFKRGEFFAAHESWEEIWLESNGRQKRLLGGLIQIAAGYLKREQRVENGARRLLLRGLAQLDAVRQPLAPPIEAIRREAAVALARYGESR